MITLLFGVLEQGLKLWNSKEGRKYLDRVIKLKKEWHEEYIKSLDVRSDDKLDGIEYELRVLSESFVQAAGAPDAKD